MAAADTISLPDGTRAWTCEREPPAGTPRRGAVVIVHGLGEHSGRYEELAAHLGAQGLGVFTFDGRGHGRSEGARGAIPHEGAPLDDLASVFAIAARHASARGDSQPPLLLGHSLGATIAAAAVARGLVAPRGLIISSPALALRLSGPERALAAATLRLAPDRQFPNRLPVDRLSHDPAVAAAYRADPLVHDRITPRMLAFIRSAGAAVLGDAPRIGVPTLLLVAGSDALVDPAGSRLLAERLPPAHATVRWYDELEHEVFNEAPELRGQVLADLDAWLERLLSRR
jgi:alpha-beta hydrolase superfamily lysophospholipase